MKNILIGTTALCAVGLMVGTAVAAEKIKLGLGGYWRAQMQFGSQDDNSTTDRGFRDHGFGSEGEVYFKGKTTLDNGITFGVMVQLEAETSADQMDNNYIYSSGSFGRVEYGETWGPSLLMSYGGVGEKNHTGDFASFNPSVALNGLGLRSYGGSSGVNGLPTEKMAYYSPRMSGFQAGISYAPEPRVAGSNGARDSEVGGQQGSEMVDMAVNYTGNLGGAKVGAFASYFDSETEAAAVGAVAAADVSGHGLGAQVSMNGFKIGARYVNIEDIGGAGNDRTTWRIGADYGMGPWSVGATYMVAQQDFTGASDDETTYWSVGANYAVGPGISLYGGVVNYDYDDSTNALASEGDNMYGILGSKISF